MFQKYFFNLRLTIVNFSNFSNFSTGAMIAVLTLCHFIFTFFIYKLSSHCNVKVIELTSCLRAVRVRLNLHQHTRELVRHFIRFEIKVYVTLIKNKNVY